MSVPYSMLAAQLCSLIDACSLPLPTMANMSALLWQNMTKINWVGFYLLKRDKLVLGPFQGKTACITIPVGRGVCGTAVAEKAVQLIRNVHEFPGHIACDSASNSEIVVPMFVDGKIIGVLDIDSPEYGRFTEEDVAGLQTLCSLLTEKCFWSDGII